jgi:outer membrane protein OmpA-like peptidoglycan-associated protein
MKDLGPTTVQSFGSRDPLVPTGPQVDEPRNRRVEVHVL